jgi:3-methyl-2-oxobutanoate hydroxymethyltransferase
MQTLRNLYKKGEPITMLTAHDFPSAYVAEAAGMEMVLVGDSLAMVALGMQDTSEVGLEDMLLHCRSVARAAQNSFTVRKEQPRPQVQFRGPNNRSLPGCRSSYGLL